MKRLRLVLALALLAAGHGAPTGAEPPRGRAGPGTANPSALIAAEIAFARAAHEKGQWTAFRDFADQEAVMFVPQPIMAKAWLKERKDPPSSIQWQPYQVWISCDGTLGVTKGAWQRPDGAVGYFTTIWRQQKDGGYRWVLDQGNALTSPLKEPDMLSASVADCPARREGALRAGSGRQKQPAREKLRVAGADGGGRSDDGTLTWTYHVAADNARTLSVSLRKDGAMAQVLSVSVAAGASR